jgi:hypothetical protein
MMPTNRGCRFDQLSMIRRLLQRFEIDGVFADIDVQLHFRVTQSDPAGVAVEV